jgi:hypothetical protein
LAEFFVLHLHSGDLLFANSIFFLQTPNGLQVIVTATGDDARHDKNADGVT